MAHRRTDRAAPERGEWGIISLNPCVVFLCKMPVEGSIFRKARTFDEETSCQVQEATSPRGGGTSPPVSPHHRPGDAAVEPRGLLVIIPSDSVAGARVLAASCGGVDAAPGSAYHSGSNSHARNPVEHIGDVDPPVRRLAVVHPDLRLLEAIAKFLLGPRGFLRKARESGGSSSYLEDYWQTK